MTDLPNQAQDGDADATTPETASDTTESGTDVAEPVIDAAPTTAEEITTARADARRGDGYRAIDGYRADGYAADLRERRRTACRSCPS